MTTKSLGQIAYEAYCETTGWKSAVSGAPLPQWTEQAPKISEAWEAAARAVASVRAVLPDNTKSDPSMCQPFVRAFTEWERRYRETPHQFMSDFERFTKSEQSYGESAAAYFVALLDELSGGRPWNTIATEAKP